MSFTNEPSLSSQSPKSNISGVEGTLDLVGVANRLEKKCLTPTYNTPSSRESTPYVTIDAKGFIVEIESLRNRITTQKDTFTYGEWRRENIIDTRYWQIEADYFESCCRDHLIRGREQGERQEALYHQHRSIYWRKLCEMQGYANDRMSIEAVDYWRREFYSLFDEKVQIEEEISRAKREQNNPGRGSGEGQKNNHANFLNKGIQGSHTNFSSLPLDPCSHRTFSMPRRLTRKQDAKPGVVLDHSARVSKDRKRSTSNVEGTLDSRLPRRSSRQSCRPKQL
jgi:hypothetical protein